MNRVWFQSCFSGAICFALAVGAVLPARADIVRPAGVAGQSFWSNFEHPLNLINGSGLVDTGGGIESATALHNQTGFWHATETFGVGFGGGGPAVVANESLTFTLPGTYNLTAAHIWQFNQPGLASRGVNQYDLSVSSDGVSWTPMITNGILAISGGGNIPVQSPNFDSNATATGVRFARLQIDSAHSGAANEYVGLSEVRFEGTQTSGGALLTTGAAANSAGLTMQPTSTDLLQGKIAASSKNVFFGNPNEDGLGLARLTDGVGDNNFDHRLVTNEDFGIWQLTYSATELGFAVGESLDINRINVFGYNTDRRRFTDFDVQYTTDGSNWEYLFIGAANASVPEDVDQVALSSLALADDSMAMLTGVVGLRFDFRPIGYGVGAHSSLIEIDVMGSVVPEPSAMTLLMVGAVGMSLFRRGYRR